MYCLFLQAPHQPGQPFKFTVAENCDRIKEEFSFLQAQYHRYVLLLIELFTKIKIGFLDFEMNKNSVFRVVVTSGWTVLKIKTGFRGFETQRNPEFRKFTEI